MNVADHRGSRLGQLALALGLFLAGSCRLADPELNSNGKSAPLPAPAVFAADPGALARDVAWLAADEREGRRAGTPAEREVARFLAARLRVMGLEPAGEGEGYFQEFPVPLEVVDRGRSFVRNLELEGALPQRDREHIVPLFCSAPGYVAGPVEFRGYGISSPANGWDDWDSAAGVAEEERGEGFVAWIVSGAPKARSEDQDFEAGSGLYQKVMTAKHSGASAVVIAQHPASEQQGLQPFANGHRAEAGIPALLLSRELAAQLWPLYNEAVQAMDAAWDRHGRACDYSRSGAPDLELQSDVEREMGVGTNVLGILRGQGGGPTTIVGAHYDHLGHGDIGSRSAQHRGQIHNGADDNASGTAVLLEMARLLSESNPVGGDVLFAFWSGEEMGLLGSEYWATHPSVSLSSLNACLNLDMVGRAGDGSLQVLGAGSAREFESWMGPAGALAGLDLSVQLSGSGVGGSDHMSFLRREIPALHLFSGLHADYHAPSDDADRFEPVGAARVTEFALDLLQRMQHAGDLAFVEPPAGANRRAGMEDITVSFGSVPNYAFGGPGLLLDGTRPDGPARKAGFLRGDVLLEFGGIAIGDIHDFVYALSQHRPGQLVEVLLQRADERLSLWVTLEARSEN